MNSDITYIMFEGGEGCGKTLLTNWLVGELAYLGHQTLLVHEPGSTPVGAVLRNILTSDVSMEHHTQVLLYSAARYELLSTVVAPAMNENKIVVSDRGYPSTLAYEGDSPWIHSIVDQTAFLKPDIIFWLDVSPDIGLARKRAQGEIMRWEKEDVETHWRIHARYERQCMREPQRWCRIDGTQPIEYVKTDILIHLGISMQLEAL